MSLYKFIESFIDENPDIKMINVNNQMSYKQVYSYYEGQVIYHKLAKKISYSVIS